MSLLVAAACTTNPVAAQAPAASTTAPVTTGPNGTTGDGDVVITRRDGSSVAGRIEELVPYDHVTVVGLDGRRVTVPWSDVERMRSASAPTVASPRPSPVEPPAPAADVDTDSDSDSDGVPAFGPYGRPVRSEEATRVLEVRGNPDLRLVLELHSGGRSHPGIQIPAPSPEPIGARSTAAAARMSPHAGRPAPGWQPPESSTAHWVSIPAPSPPVEVCTAPCSVRLVEGALYSLRVMAPDHWARPRASRWRVVRITPDVIGFRFGTIERRRLRVRWAVATSAVFGLGLASYAAGKLLGRDVEGIPEPGTLPNLLTSGGSATMGLGLILLAHTGALVDRPTIVVIRRRLPVERAAR